ncbi:unnamed protein product [Vitrella brassicaformis CCMP3155]|uniref:Uncharacterized protein n=1 Tax=Vitrella brassicaformis (strain CCMP3155) TaxID=1169540 RepID=A0A0G4FT07_VITBC|nr:unnamed protein product [Vitrella brassicaformis CCMP3155]|mmetsp:Transcript_1613/g.3491  ORF Transcript_1613/g.3491 Transcript_1613/m.3491 type:complete len:247 (-) Transcript_1613:142-882(-)|eukprot:CEM17487.1 unnamed protein product [Vitrella brassicaformis CCMP3155]
MLLRQAAATGQLEELEADLTSVVEHINDLDDKGFTALCESAREKRPASTIAWLVEHGADANIPDPQMQTPLHWSCQHGESESASVLLRAPGVDPSPSDAMGRTPLHWMCQHGQGDVLSLAITNPKCDVSKKTKSGDSALHWAARAGASECCHTLIQKGLKVTDANTRGETPVGLAKSHGIHTQLEGWQEEYDRSYGVHHGSVFTVPDENGAPAAAAAAAGVSAAAGQPKAAAAKPKAKMKITLKKK